MADNYLRMLAGGPWQRHRIVDSNLSPRARNVLLAERLITAGDVAKLSPRDILRLPNCGRKTSIEVIFWLLAIAILEEGWARG